MGWHPCMSGRGGWARVGSMREWQGWARVGCQSDFSMYH